jgi:hypothetical protein
MDNQQSNLGLNSTQKTGFVLLLVFGLLAVGLGFLQMRNAIYGPFVVRLVDDTDTSGKIFLDEEARLQTIDTDHDGINDWEELNFYDTSPYLPDTDSDGTGDKEEIEQGSNPTCAENRDICEDVTPKKEIEKEIEIVDDIEVVDEVVPVSESENEVVTVPEVLTDDDFSEMLSNPEMIRKLLLSSGQMTEEQLAELPDTVLVEILTDILVQQSAESSSL